MSKYKTEAVSINRAEYQGRLEFAGNGGFLLKNVSLDDEGYVKFSVDFEDGSNLQQQIALNVTSKFYIFLTYCIAYPSFALHVNISNKL